SVTEAVIHAGGPSLVDAGVDRGRTGRRVPAERSGGRGHLVEKSGAVERRHRVLALAHALEDVAALVDLALDVAGLARDADLVFDLVVVRLELFESQGPVLDRGTLGDARRPVAPLRFADDLEVP